jgi:WhiB family redox-sensing transcriptional regulator
MAVRNVMYAPPWWMGKAACAGADPELFFPAPGESAEPALAICRGCPVRLHCLQDALEHPAWGVWGGFSERNRAEARTRHNKGRSLEDLIAASDAFFHAKLARENLKTAA